MSTKDNPGAFRCFEAALPDEPIFTLLARDPAAPATLDFWASERERVGKTANPDDIDRIVDARRDVHAMRRWRQDNLNVEGAGPAWKLVKITDDDGGPVRIMPDNVQYVPASRDGDEAVRVNLHWLRRMTEELCAGNLSREQFAGYMELACTSPDRRVKMDDTVPVEQAAADAAKRDERYIGLLAAVNDTIQMLDDKAFASPAATLSEVRRSLIAGIGGLPYAASDDPVAEEARASRLFEQAHKPRPPVVDTEPGDLAHAPEVPPHRFSQWFKGERYAYARGLEINPTHLPIALDAMAVDGWDLLSIFGATDSKNVGFIFQRRLPPMVSFEIPPVDDHTLNELRRFMGSQPLGQVFHPHDGGRESEQSRQFLDGAPLDEIAAGKPPVAERFTVVYAERVGPTECRIVEVDPAEWPEWAIGCGPAGRGNGMEL